MRIGLLLVFIAFPLLELAVLIKIGQEIGFWWTMLILVGTAIAGSTILHAQGFAAMHRVMTETQQGRLPIEPVVDTMFLVVAGLLLLTPGLITDAIGGILLVPPLRRIIARTVMRRMLSMGSVHVETHTYGSGSREGPTRPDAPKRPRRGPDEGIVIDGEWERVDDKRKRDPNDKQG